MPRLVFVAAALVCTWCANFLTLAQVPVPVCLLLFAGHVKSVETKSPHGEKRHAFPQAQAGACLLPMTDDDDVYYYIVERLKLERETENSGV